MTNRQFYAALRRTKNKFRWTYTLTGIRARTRNNYTGVFCPLEAIDYTLNNVSFPSFVGSARRLEINDELTNNIVAAADCTPEDNQLNSKQKRIRKAMLNALGFKGRFA